MSSQLHCPAAGVFVGESRPTALELREGGQLACRLLHKVSRSSLPQHLSHGLLQRHCVRVQRVSDRGVSVTPMQRRLNWAPQEVLSRHGHAAIAIAGLRSCAFPHYATRATRRTSNEALQVRNSTGLQESVKPLYADGLQSATVHTRVSPVSPTRTSTLEDSHVPVKLGFLSRVRAAICLARRVSARASVTSSQGGVSYLGRALCGGLSPRSRQRGADKSPSLSTRCPAPTRRR